MKNLFERTEYEPIELIVLSNKKPKELKGKTKVASVKCRGKTYQLFIDDKFNLYYKDNSVLIESESHISHDDFYGDKVEVNHYYSKLWFKITGLYKRRHEFILDTLKELAKASEKQYTENSVGNNVALEDLYEKLIKEYLNYLNIK